MSLPSPSLRITGMALFVFQKLYSTHIERTAYLACYIRRTAETKEYYA
jgi:hypothetical protein